MMFLKPVRAIDLFCGIGGNSLGAQQASVDIVAGFDKWDLAGKVYQDNFPKAHFFCNSLQEVDVEQVKDQLGSIDLILASPECTSHSVARGNKVPSEESMNLAFEVLRFAKELNPRWIIIENVTAMKSWSGYQQFIRGLQELYQVRQQNLLASDFNVPQRRRRLYILCDRDQKPETVYKPIESGTLNAADILDINGSYNYSPLVTKKRALSTLERARLAIVELGENTPFLLVYYGTDKGGGWQRLDEPLRTITTLDRFALVKPVKDGHVMRMLQPPELQAAMGFPADFKLEFGIRRERIHMLGNAVCPPVMKAIVNSLIGSDQSNLHANRSE